MLFKNRLFLLLYAFWSINICRHEIIKNKLRITLQKAESTYIKSISLITEKWNFYTSKPILTFNKIALN